MIILSKPPAGPTGRSRIDVWWRGKQNNGDLMLLLAYLLTLNPAWRNAAITRGLCTASSATGSKPC